MRRRPVALLAAFLAASTLSASPASAEVRTYYCVFNQRQVVPPVSGSRGSGSGRFVIDTDANTVAYWISFTKLGSAETVAHIHGNFISSPGINATIRATLPPGNPKVGVWSYTEDLETMILSGFAYADIHTSDHVDGELRGQIVPLNAVLDGLQPISPVATTAAAWATFTIDKPAHQLSYYISYTGMGGALTAAHFHGPALYGVGAGIKFALALGASPMSGTVSYAPADEVQILDGRWYVDLLSATTEIRGQICPLVVPMDASQVVPPVAEPWSSGFALVSIDTLANVIGFDVHVDSVRIASTASHIHGFAHVGQNAGQLVSLLAGSRRIGSWTYGAANEPEMLLGHAYVDAHTSTHPGGEIRGQLMRLPGAGPLVGVAGPLLAAVHLAASPNPSSGRTRLSYRLAHLGSVALRVVDVDGRLVRHVSASGLEPGPQTWDWDGRDDAGREVAPGLYFAWVRTPDGQTVTRVARIH